MSTITFDTHKLIRKMRDAGLPESQAEAVAEALKEAHEGTEAVSKKDLQIELAPIRADLTLLKWMTGMIAGGIAALILKAFFA